MADTPKPSDELELVPKPEDLDAEDAADEVRGGFTIKQTKAP